MDGAEKVLEEAWAHLENSGRAAQGLRFASVGWGRADAGIFCT